MKEFKEKTVYADYTNDFMKLICDRLGLVIGSHQKKDLAKTIQNACEKFKCAPEEYLKLIKNCSSHSPLLEHLVAGVTVGETYFFRDRKQIDLLQNLLLPKIINNKIDEKNLSLRIWSAGCASGEEIYTIAILIYEMLDHTDKWNIHFLGTDINTHSLNKAISGIYSEWSMRSTNAYFKEKYFIQKNKTYEVIDEIKELVKFDYLNLNENSYPSIFNSTNSQDLILCRNVLIYFDSQKIKKLMSKLSNSLNQNGYLLLGASDPIETNSTNLIFHHKYGMLFSKKPVDQVLIEEQKNAQVLHENRIDRELMHTETTASAALKSNSINITIPQHDLIAKLLNESKWNEVLSILDSIHELKKSTFLLSAKAVSLANIGKLEEAILYFQKLIKMDPTNKHAYFTYSLTLIEMNKLSEAEKLLRNTLYLDNQFVVAHYQLGLLLLRNKQNTAGLKCLKNALSISSTHNPDQEVSDSPGLSYGRLSEILKYEIDIYSKEQVNSDA